MDLVTSLRRTGFVLSTCPAVCLPGDLTLDRDAAAMYDSFVSVAYRCLQDVACAIYMFIFNIIVIASLALLRLSA